MDIAEHVTSVLGDSSCDHNQGETPALPSRARPPGGLSSLPGVLPFIQRVPANQNTLVAIDSDSQIKTNPDQIVIDWLGDQQTIACVTVRKRKLMIEGQAKPFCLSRPSQ